MQGFSINCWVKLLLVRFSIFLRNTFIWSTFSQDHTEYHFKHKALYPMFSFKPPSWKAPDRCGQGTRWIISLNLMCFHGARLGPKTTKVSAIDISITLRDLVLSTHLKSLVGLLHIVCIHWRIHWYHLACAPLTSSEFSGSFQVEPETWETDENL